MCSLVMHYLNSAKSLKKRENAIKRRKIGEFMKSSIATQFEYDHSLSL